MLLYVYYDIKTKSIILVWKSLNKMQKSVETGKQKSLHTLN